MDYYDEKNIQFYKDFMESRGGRNYEIDGPINSKKWNTVKHKILFVLKETAGYEKLTDNKKYFFLKDELKNIWLKDMPKKTKNGTIKYNKNPTYEKCAILAKSIQIAFDRGRFLTKDEIDNIDTGTKSLIDAIENCAIININKYSNSEKNSCDENIRSEFTKNRKLLLWQIEKLSPTIVYAGSNVCFECLANKNNGLYKDIITAPEHIKKFTCEKFAGIVFYYGNHPAARNKHEIKIQEIQKQIFDKMIK
jgi:hypothetical protein